MTEAPQDNAKAALENIKALITEGEIAIPEDLQTAMDSIRGAGERMSQLAVTSGDPDAPHKVTTQLLELVYGPLETAWLAYHAGDPMQIAVIQELAEKMEAAERKLKDGLMTVDADFEEAS